MLLLVAYARHQNSFNKIKTGTRPVLIDDLQDAESGFDAVRGYVSDPHRDIGTLTGTASGAADTLDANGARAAR